MVDLIPYTAEEIAEILRPAFRSQSVDDAFLVALARMCRLNPREALLRADELLTHHRFQAATYPLSRAGLDRMASETWQVDEHGLRPSDLAYLRALGDGRRGISALTQMLPVGQDEILNVIEPYLLQLGLIRMTGAGRELTEIGRRRCG
jgi:Holliday junction resolvasome RuvABC ATP-dependent DNA helicase subunit